MLRNYFERNGSINISSKSSVCRVSQHVQCLRRSLNVFGVDGIGYTRPGLKKKNLRRVRIWLSEQMSKSTRQFEKWIFLTLGIHFGTFMIERAQNHSPVRMNILNFFSPLYSYDIHFSLESAVKNAAKASKVHQFCIAQKL